MDFLSGQGFTTGYHEHATGILRKKYQSSEGKSWIPGIDMHRRCNADALLETEHVGKHWGKHAFVHGYHPERHVETVRAMGTRQMKKIKTTS